MRNHVEWKFGQGKNGYNLDQIRAKRKDTSESWISAILFIMNLTKLMKVTVEQDYYLAFYAMKHLRTVFLPVVVSDYIMVSNRRAIPV